MGASSGARDCACSSAFRFAAPVITIWRLKAPFSTLADIVIRGSGAPGARIGTVDKFRGQEGAVVLYSMATSSPEDAPRGMDFLYCGHRFNVAVSRARGKKARRKILGPFTLQISGSAAGPEVPLSPSVPASQHVLRRRRRYPFQRLDPTPEAP